MIREKYFDHIQETIREKIEKLEKRKKELYHLSSQIFNLHQEEFKCPSSKSNYDALCPQCPEALPEITEGIVAGKHRIFVSYPPGSKLKKIKTEGCREWIKKRKSSACGCGGKVTCICGYQYEFCAYIEKDKFCPHCGRECKVEFSKLFKINVPLLKKGGWLKDGKDHN